MQDITIHHQIDLAGAKALLQAINDLKEQTKMDHAELAAAMNAIAAQLAKANGEVQKKLADLQAAVDAAGNVPQSVVDALAALTTDAQALDDIVPDAPPQTP